METKHYTKNLLLTISTIFYPPLLALCFTLCLMLGGQIANAQLINTSFFKENLATVNPAVFDMEYLQYKLKNSAGGSFQEQWVGFSDDGEHQFTFNGFADVIPRKTNFIWGVNFTYDQAAAFQLVQFGIRGAVRMPIGTKYHNLSVGVNLGAGMNFLRVNKVTTVNDIDPLLSISDNRNLIGFYPKAGVGLYYYYYRDGRNSYFFGASLPNAIPMNFSYENNTIDTLANQYLFGYAILQHVSFQAGYRMYFGRDFIDISGWMKRAITEIDNASFPTQWNIFVKYHLNNIFWVGGGVVSSLKNESAMAQQGVLGAFGIDLPMASNGMLLQFGVSYYTDMGELQIHSNGTPELFVRVSRF